MFIILDKDSKTIDVPCSYTNKLYGINRMIAECGSLKIKLNIFSSFINKYFGML